MDEIIQYLAEYIGTASETGLTGEQCVRVVEALDFATSDMHAAQILSRPRYIGTHAILHGNVLKYGRAIGRVQRDFLTECYMEDARLTCAKNTWSQYHEWNEGMDAYHKALLAMRRWELGQIADDTSEFTEAQEKDMTA